jgi:lipopolysaccharide export system protein LptA
MAPLSPDSRRTSSHRTSLLAAASTLGMRELRLFLPLCALAWLSLQQLADAASIRSRGDVRIEYATSEGVFSAGTIKMTQVTLTQGEGTVIKADEGYVSNVEGDFDNAQWQLTGKVHVEFEGAVVDADTAVVTFAAGRPTAVRVRGTPARFSHLAKMDNIRRQGRAPAIDFDSSTGWVRFSGGTSFSQVGKDIEITGEELNYNVNTTDYNDGKSPTPDRIVIPRDAARVPPPRTPDRSTSQ